MDTGPHITVIALGHTKGVGKNTIGRILLEQFEAKGFAVECSSFAGPVKETAHWLYDSAGVRDEDYYELHPEEKDIVLPKLGLTPREVWIKISDDLAALYPRVWFDRACNSIDYHTEVVIFTDLRYKREWDLLKQLNVNVVFVKVTRDGTKLVEDGAEEQLINADWDLTIHNNIDVNEPPALADMIEDYIAAL